MYTSAFTQIPKKIALPDVRDGLKPVHRRVLYGMYDMGVLSSRAYKKSAAIVSEVLSKEIC